MKDCRSREDNSHGVVLVHPKSDVWYDNLECIVHSASLSDVPLSSTYKQHM